MLSQIYTVFKCRFCGTRHNGLLCPNHCDER